MSPEFVGAKDVIRTEHEVSLTPDDQVWLASFGVDPLWQDNPALLDELTSIIAIGSRRLNDPVNQTTEAHTEIIQARIQFMNFIGVPEATLGTFLAIKPTIVPLDTFINTQRTFTQLGLDAAKVINASPAAIGYAPESVRAKFDNLTQLGLDAAKVINASPAAIGYAPESVRAKFDNLTQLGLDAAKVINASPTAISYAAESVRAKFDNLTQLGLDAAKIINALPVAISLAPESVRAKFGNLTQLGLDAAKVFNALPAAIGYAPESVRAKFDNLIQLGLDAAKVINALPAAISYAPESVRAKFAFLEESIALLNWEYSAQELVQTYPAVLGFSPQKLRILRRIAAYHIDKSSRSADPKQVRASLIVPLEKYVIALSQANDYSIPKDISELSKEAARLRLDASERKAKALSVAPQLGKIGTMYLRYQNK